MPHFGHANELSIKRQQRADRHPTAKTKHVKNGRCLGEKLVDCGEWPSGQPKQYVTYLHVTRGWRFRLLPPLHNRLLRR